jgi:hypothetical protein
LAALKTVISWLSYLFHLLLALLLLGLASIALASGPLSLHLEMLPWSGAKLDYILLGGALIGLVSVVLAVLGRLKFLFLLWSFAVAVLLTKGYIFSSYRFGADGWHSAVYLMAAAWIAVAGAWFQLRSRPRRGPREYRLK